MVVNPHRLCGVRKRNALVPGERPTRAAVVTAALDAPPRDLKISRAGVELGGAGVELGGARVDSGGSRDHGGHDGQGRGQGGDDACEEHFAESVIWGKELRVLAKRVCGGEQG